MREEKAFLDAVGANPDDDQVRLVYADWLEEHGDPRGEFLRVRCQMKALPGESDRTEPLRTRLQELQSAISPEWLVAVDRAFIEDNVREAVFRHEIGEGGPTGLCFLRVEGGDPSPELLSRFRGTCPVVKPASAARGDLLADEGLYDPETGQRGILFYLLAIHWLGPGRCEVEAGTIADPLAGTGFKYQVELRDGQWRVTDASWSWIS
ncbi:MAG: TIGR02996 domain-containing protein [Gemmataceae bacterium]|nr:TIGR02996 domain-containing protein [Gemmataceae bacterium]